jgi:hypothetical protein
MAVRGQLFIHHYQVYACACLYMTAICAAWYPCV